MSCFFAANLPALELAFPGQGERILLVIAGASGGERWSVPSIDELDRIQRDKRICQLYKGANISELALRFQLSESQVRRIVVRG